MKRFAIILLIAFFGLSQSVQGVHLHFCSDQLAAIDFINLEQKSSGTCGACSKAKSCCSDVVQIFQRDAFSHAVNSIEIKAPVLVPSFVYHTFLYNRLICEVKNSQNFIHPVPDGDIPIYLLHRQFRI